MTGYFKEVRGVAARTNLSSIFSENFAEKSLRKIWGFNPGTAGKEARTLPVRYRCYAAPLTGTLKEYGSTFFFWKTFLALPFFLLEMISHRLCLRLWFNLGRYISWPKIHFCSKLWQRRMASRLPNVGIQFGITRIKPMSGEPWQQEDQQFNSFSFYFCRFNLIIVFQRDKGNSVLCTSEILFSRFCMVIRQWPQRFTC